MFCGKVVVTEGKRFANFRATKHWKHAGKTVYSVSKTVLWKLLMTCVGERKGGRQKSPLLDFEKVCGGDPPRPYIRRTSL